MMNPSILDSIDPKVLGARLRESRNAAGSTQDAVARELGIARTTLVAIEKGERRVTADELIRLVKLYGRSVSDLVSKHTVVDGFVAQFRATLKHYLSQEPDFEKVTVSLQRLAEDYVELERLMKLPLSRSYPPPYPLEGSLDQAAEDVAAMERNRLGLGDGPIPSLRSRLEGDVGIRIFFLEMPSRLAGLFVYNEEIGACMGINSLHPYERQNWSLAHELAHFLTSRFSPEIQLLSNEKRSRNETFADSFAANFLMPSGGLNRRFSEFHRSNPNGVTLADICTLADSYQVSVEALIRRLEELKRLPGGMWDRLRAQSFKPRAAQAMPGLLRDRQNETLPSRYIYLAVQAFRDGRLSEGQLAKYLRIDRVAARVWVERIEQRIFSEEEGAFETVSVDFAEPLHSMGR